MTKRKRFVIEGTWSGYTSSQSRVVHVEVSDSPKFVEWVRNTYEIYYTDGTSLILSVRECKPRERVKERPSYQSLLRDCFYQGVNSVDKLQKYTRIVADYDK